MRVPSNRPVFTVFLSDKNCVVKKSFHFSLIKCIIVYQKGRMIFIFLKNLGGPL
jgi:hypothetical protein